MPAQSWVGHGEPGTTIPINGTDQPYPMAYVAVDAATSVEEAFGVDPSYVEFLDTQDWSISWPYEWSIDVPGDVVVEFWSQDGSPSLLYTETVNVPAEIHDTNGVISWVGVVPVGYFQVVIAAESTAVGEVVQGNYLFTTRLQIVEQSGGTGWHVGYVGSRS